MSRKFRIWVTLLIAPVAAVLALVVLGLADQDGQATLVFGIWGLILLGAACLLVLGVQCPLPWRLLGAVVFTGVVAYFASGYDSELSGPKRNTYGGSIILAGVVGAYFAITGRIPSFLHKAVTEGRAGNERTTEGEKNTEGEDDIHDK